MQYQCKKEVKSLAACYGTDGKKDRAACFDQFLAFDMCTEDF